MKRFLVLAGFTAALGLAAPVPAQAVTVVPALAVQGGAQVELVRGNDHRHHGRGYDRHRGGPGYGHRPPPPRYHHRPPPPRYHHRPPPVVHHYHHAPRPWAHWRPYVVRHHYHSFGAPVYYTNHPHYGHYYRVRARDRNNIAVWLGISAITGAILFSNY